MTGSSDEITDSITLEPTPDAPAEATAEATGDRFSLSAEQRRTGRVSLILFLFTFLVYWLIGPMHTAFDFQLSQANNIVHGHLYLDPQHTHNLNLLERVLYDGQGFCLPIGDKHATDGTEYTIPVQETVTCRRYMQHSLGPALLLLPFAFFLGLTVNQVLVSAFVGALAAPVVWWITRKFSDHFPTQLALTALALFGTTFMFAAADGGVWYFAHATAVLFTFLSIWATVVRRNPVLAGAFVGAAFMCRPTLILAGIFPLLAFSEQWLTSATATARSGWQRLRSRIHIGPLVGLAVGVLPFIALTMLLNYLRFGKPFETGYSYSEQIYQANLAASTYQYGLFDLRYIGRHIQIFWEQMPHFSKTGSYVWPTWAGQAMWSVSPALLIGLFVHLRHSQRVAFAMIVAVVIAMAVIIGAAVGTSFGWFRFDVDTIPFGLQLAPFWILVETAVVLAIARRDRLVIAAWATILALVLVDWTFAATGWSQFGYRYGLDFMPFLFLLVVVAVPRARWYHVALIGVSILINLWGALWIFKFAAAHLFNWTWVGW